MPEAGFQTNSQSNNIADIYPLSPMQEGILFHSVAAPASGQYMPQTALRISGEVDEGALKMAWQQTVDRQPVLRSGFYWEERDEPFQIVFRSLPLPWSVLDWSAVEKDKHEAMLSDLFASNRKTPFDLKRPPLLRVQWIVTGPGEHILVVSYHHIILDGWSIRQLLEEAMLLYRRFSGLPARALAAARPYSDYIGWLRKQDHAASLEFWRTYLSGSPSPTRLLRDDTGGGFARHEWICPEELFRSLNRLCETSGCTMNTVLQCALGLLIARQTGRTDLIFGTTTAGRPGTLAGATAMIGLFINTVPVRIVFEPGRTLETWLQDHQRRQAATIDHEYVPLRRIQGSGEALFDTLLVVENFSSQTAEADGLPFRANSIDFDEQTHFPLTIWAIPKTGSLTILIGHSRDAVAPNAVAALVTALSGILSDMARCPDEPLAMHLGRIDDRPIGTDFADANDQPSARDAASLSPGARATEALTATETTVSRIWAELLRTGAVGRNANFFELGGHSLLAARVVSRLRSELSLELPVRTLFDKPVLSDLAAHIDGMRREFETVAGHVEVTI